jgi:hypothetical protein
MELVSFSKIVDSSRKTIGIYAIVYTFHCDLFYEELIYFYDLSLCFVDCESIGIKW